MSETLAGRHALSGGDPEDLGTSGAIVDPDGDTRSMEPPLQPPLAVPTPGSAAEQQVTCPECGTVAMVAVNRRESGDFCARCDFPLFWTPSTIVLDSTGGSGESLRRLPGTSGQAVVASLACPHCAEGNPITAVTCARCGGLMNPPPPEPEPVYVAPPPPPAPEPERTLPWWAWVAGGLTLLLLMALVVYFFATR